MYMMGLGGKPIGECYLSPPGAPEKGAPNEAWLIGHYYSGGNVKLLKFKEPLETPEEGSPMDRIIKSEDRDLFILNKMKEIVDFIKDTLGTDLDAPKNIQKEITKLEEFIATRDELLKCEDAKYLASNMELLSATRGW